MIPLKDSLVRLASDIADKRYYIVWGEGRKNKKQKNKLILWVNTSPSHFKTAFQQNYTPLLKFRFKSPHRGRRLCPPPRTDSKLSAPHPAPRPWNSSPHARLRLRRASRTGADGARATVRGSRAPPKLPIPVQHLL